MAELIQTTLPAIRGKWIVITGKVAGYTRDSIHARIRQEGGTPEDSVSFRTDYVVVGERPGKVKLAAAELYGKPLYDQGALLLAIDRAVRERREARSEGARATRARPIQRATVTAVPATDEVRIVSVGGTYDADKTGRRRAWVLERLRLLVPDFPENRLVTLTTPSAWRSEDSDVGYIQDTQRIRSACAALESAGHTPLVGLPVIDQRRYALLDAVGPWDETTTAFAAAAATDPRVTVAVPDDLPPTGRTPSASLLASRRDAARNERRAALRGILREGMLDRSAVPATLRSVGAALTTRPADCQVVLTRMREPGGEVSTTGSARNEGTKAALRWLNARTLVRTVNDGNTRATFVLDRSVDKTELADAVGWGIPLIDPVAFYEWAQRLDDPSATSVAQDTYVDQSYDPILRTTTSSRPVPTAMFDDLIAATTREEPQPAEPEPEPNWLLGPTNRRTRPL